MPAAEASGVTGGDGSFSLTGGLQQQDTEGTSPFLTSFLGLSSIFAALGMVSQAYLPRLQLPYSITAQFDEGDPAYQWILLFLTQENVNVWRSLSSMRRKWSVKTCSKVKGNTEYVPTYQQPQLFRWRGRWLEIKRSNELGEARFTSAGTFNMCTLDMGLFSELVEDARQRYIEVNRPNVVIHLADAPNFGPTLWSSVKRQAKDTAASQALVHDAREFIASEDWYVEAGIPHRRGYLLYGPPGTGKTSQRRLYMPSPARSMSRSTLSHAPSFVDDVFLARAASSIPKNSIFLIEDIDCAFPSRDDEDELADFAAPPVQGGARMPTPPGFPVQASGRAVRSLVTLSGLLNVIDGVGSEEGKLFFATLSARLRADGRHDEEVEPDGRHVMSLGRARVARAVGSASLMGGPWGEQQPREQKDPVLLTTRTPNHADARTEPGIMFHSTSCSGVVPESARASHIVGKEVTEDHMHATARGRR
ncbi:hypothetical protein GGX14DRAFT_546580 [Mycena pura]|uniref:BCS1 N-terminal domain-containing protein n=1 Tax=Mycena pura TaxID=153505 RepID=A0AAD6Y555_9AGAR|nr:hypothetical protein GGX14DRAFT_546580 [Mycena pura]